jgi:hypothetical protein
MAYYLPMVQYINQDVVQNLNSMPVITLNGLKGQPLRWHSALGHRVPVISTAKCHPRRLSIVLRADLNRVDGFSPFSGISSGARSSASATPHPLQATVPTQTAHAYLQPVTSDLQSPSYAPDVWKENSPQLLETVDQSSIEVEQLKEWINTIKGYFRSMTMGNISVSPYDTAWVALVPALDGSGGPQFPKSLQWIIDNQLPDGDWAACDFFLGFDRLCNTLACVIALKTWRSGAENVERGKCPVEYHLITTSFELQRSMYAVMYDHRPSFTCKRRLHRFESPHTVTG